MLDIYGNNPESKRTKSSYQPSKEVQGRTILDKKAYQKGYDIQHTGFAEFNGLSVLQVQDRNQKIFNLYQDPEPSDPDLKWRSREVRVGARNDVISLAAHLITAMMYPNFTAQNEYDEEDREAAQIMRDMILWNIENSDYEMSMLFGVIAPCVNPCAYIGVEYIKAMQMLRADHEGKEISTKEVIDNVLSGLNVDPTPMEEILIGNVYQYYHQRQPFRIRRRFISKDIFDALYSEHDNHKYVQVGVQSIFDESDGTFYDVDETQKSDDLVEEVVIMNRRQDLEIHYVNGIYFGDKDVENNPIKHRDNEGRPKYPEAKYGYEPIDEKRFYYYRSTIDKLLPQHRRLQKMARLAEDATVLTVLKPVLQSGKAKVTQQVVYPAGVTSLPEGSKIDFLDIGANLNAIYQNMQEAEKEMAKSSQDDVRQGASASQDRTAYELSRIEQNAIIKEFAIFGRMIGAMVEDVGDLMKDCIIHHQTVLDAEEIVGGMYRLKLKQFLLRNQAKEGKRITKKIQFTDEYMGRAMDEDELLQESWKMYHQQKKEGDNVEIYKVNPALFARLKYSATVDVDTMMPKSMAFQEDRKLRAHQLLSTSPFADREAIDRDFLFDPLTEGQADKYMVKAMELGIMPGMQPGAPGAPTLGGGNPQPVPALNTAEGALM